MKYPVMPFRIDGAVDTVAIELICRLRNNLRPRVPGALVMTIHIRHLHMNGLCILAAKRMRACGERRPVRAANHDAAIAAFHLRMGNLAIVPEADAGFKTESLFKPVERSRRIIIKKRGHNPGTRAFLSVRHGTPPCPLTGRYLTTRIIFKQDVKYQMLSTILPKCDASCMRRKASWASSSAKRLSMTG